MARISRVPFGLQDLLGSTQFGDNPSDFSTEIRPTLDLFRFLASDSIFHNTQNVTNAPLLNLREVVPTGEIWFPLFASMNGRSVVGGDVMDFAIFFDDFRGAGSTIPIGSQTFTTAAALERFTFFVQFEHLFAMPTGTAIFGNTGNLTTANAGATFFDVTYYKFSA